MRKVCSTRARQPELAEAIGGEEERTAQAKGVLYSSPTAGAGRGDRWGEEERRGRVGREERPGRVIDRNGSGGDASDVMNNEVS
ncbi:hypothetical protein GQ55_9G210100 [Panicum hallii var. hallii]|uniref:Uncharacterized protein n=1 Tax=Panicum hallii var. hallii TaxID=1504633 RepID=A0A2T7C5J4_9POAL|nr:hypothetical protein GQ55_9G210100 [Panicum hallii var. hallii]